MKVTHVLTALGTLCFQLSDASTEESPVIIGPHHIKLKASPGKKLVLHCKAKYPDDLTLMYWLVNGSFPEEAFNNDRMIETEESTSADGTVLQRSLVLKNVMAEDFRSTFICVVTNSAGIARKSITLKPMKTRRIR